MSLLRHNCPNCEQDLSFPENFQRVSCPQCGHTYSVEHYQNLVTLRLDTSISEPIHYRADTSEGSLQESLEILNEQILKLERQLTQERLSGLSSLALALLFTAFAIFSLLMERELMGLLCGMLALVMAVIGVLGLKSSARLRTALTLRLEQRNQIQRELRPQTPRIF